MHTIHEIYEPLIEKASNFFAKNHCEDISLMVRFRMEKGSSFPLWKNLTTNIDLIVFYLDSLDL